ncbi:Contains similarity to purine permease from Arabidopsis thaliana gb/AF078531. EST gb/AI997301 comes from this gene [Arabidopsis thaliana]|uniref:Probable purine permease 11 n=3 Tax=Arabidopsis thaliana TaxID=3702 RepID=PUP11_ARATH|nr:purine permease 11 [Arabidopsis thaliana]Q9LPF6.1 RecName: Full=Probable purine permease 11; Short=AtPUP11 [Arabidopsis thaliana]AAF78258.1 Contains similarity to purine permease from Arabidopsis thaliana gb/AF078531. EST gb/AI997301 comes from this gene [Arabidopsis thaliana]AAL32860.1 Unknown protein [Arabidopsis thaliana]AAO29976.1 Unknown protein [Arabidopsis thaliana]AEE32045.1 purine permease 11 [Arabidopsis thaliana]|eukprot:NP_175096.1 purine permease 11 [Arabidopsis thaliana]
MAKEPVRVLVTGAAGNQEPILVKEESVVGIPTPLLKLKSWQWWVLVSVNIFFLIGGQAASVLLGRFYYDEGGNSKWMATLVQTAAFPILYIPLLLLPSSASVESSESSCSLKYIVLIYVLLGVIIAGDNMLYSVGLLYLSASTYSLICATQLAFNAVFSYFINAQKFTALILNSVVLLSFSAALIALNDDADTPSGVSRSKYIVGFVCTLAASALYSLLLSLMQFSFEKILKRETFSVVLEMQIYTSLVATCVSVIGLFASGEWRTLHGEMEGYHKGQASYVLTLVWTAVTWQVCSVGVVGLIFLVTSLFSNVISTLSLAVTPLAALVVFRDKMSGVKIMAMLIAIWGFASYVYQNHIDDLKVRQARQQAQAGRVEPPC